MTLNRTPLITKLPIIIIQALRPPSGGTIALQSFTSGSLLEVFIDAQSSSSLSTFFDFVTEVSIFIDEWSARLDSNRGFASVLELEICCSNCCGSLLFKGLRIPSMVLETPVEFIFNSVVSAIVIVQIFWRFSPRYVMVI